MVFGAYGIKRGDLGAAAGGWVATARDLVRIMCATDQLANQPDLLMPATLFAMESVPFPEVDANQPHGWDTSAGKFGKDGNVGWGAAYMAKYPNGINVAIVINTGASSSDLETKVSQIKNIVVGAGVPANYDLFGLQEDAP